MSAKSWVLLDAASDHSTGDVTIEPKDVPGAGGEFMIRKRTLRGGLRDGVDIIEVLTDQFDFTVVPTRGMGLWKAGRRAGCNDARCELGWRAPVNGPVHPRHVNLFEPSGLGWLAGFDELLCRCGLESNGGPDYSPEGRLRYPLHGRIANTPAWFASVTVDPERGEIAVEGAVDESRLYHQKLRLKTTMRLTLGESQLTIADEVTNLSAEPAELQLLYHTNFGPPLLEKNARVVLPARSVIPQTPRAAEGVKAWDVYGPPEPGFTEQVYFFELAGDAEGRSQALLRNARGDLGAVLKFSLLELPYFTVWKSTQAESDGYVTGLEPSINLPNNRTFESAQGRVTKLAGGETRQFELALGVLCGAEAVAATEKHIRSLAKEAPRVFDKPQAGWSPG